MIGYYLSSNNEMCYNIKINNFSPTKQSLRKGRWYLFHRHSRDCVWFFRVQTHREDSSENCTPTSALRSPFTTTRAFPNFWLAPLRRLPPYVPVLQVAYSEYLILIESRVARFSQSMIYYQPDCFRSGSPSTYSQTIYIRLLYYIILAIPARSCISLYAPAVCSWFF